MDIVWDEQKNELLKKERKICFEDAAEIILNKQELDLFENPVRDGQAYYIINLNNYTHVVPVIINNKNQIVLKTIFPSRKFHKLYGGKNGKSNS